MTDTGVTDAFSSWEQNLPPSLLKLLRDGKSTEFDHVWNEIPKELDEADRFSVAKRSEIYGNGGGYAGRRLGELRTR